MTRAAPSSAVSCPSMSDRELHRLRRDLSEIKKSIEAMTRHLEDLETARAEIAEAKAKLAEKREELAAIKSQRDAAAAVVEAERRDVHAIVSDIVDIDEVEDAREDMRKHMKIAKAWASVKYDEAGGRLREIRDRLREAGIDCAAMNRALGANRNRPDRDFDDLYGPLDFSVE